LGRTPRCPLAFSEPPAASTWSAASLVSTAALVLALKMREILDKCLCFGSSLSLSPLSTTGRGGEVASAFSPGEASSGISSRSISTDWSRSSGFEVGTGGNGVLCASPIRRSVMATCELVGTPRRILLSESESFSDFKAILRIDRAYFLGSRSSIQLG
jgi:hypothetical protein